MTEVVQFTPAELIEGSREDVNSGIGFVGCECGVLAQAPIDGEPLNDWDELNRWYLRHAAEHEEPPQ